MEEGPDISKTAWVDVFARPSRETLVSELPPEDTAAFETVHESLAEQGWKATLVWLGLPWRWAFAYHADGSERPALAFHVPDPRGSRVCVPVPVAGDGAPDMKSLTKPVRTRLEQAAIIAGFIWPEWSSTEFDPVALKSILTARTSTD